MAYDDRLVEQVREVLAGEPTAEKKMFGGLTFMVSGHMCCGVQDDRIMVRVGPVAYAECLRCAGVKRFDVTGKPMVGMIWVEAEALRTSSQIKRWIDKGVAYVKSLPPPKQRK